MRRTPGPARRLILGLLAIPGLAGASLHAQQLPPAGELDRLQAEAEAAPLFAGEEPLALHLFVDLDVIRGDRPDEEELAGLIRFQGEQGGWTDAPVDVRTRGGFRREARNCSFPPLRLDLPRGRMEGTVFHGQDKLKVVLPCRDGRNSYQVLVLREYLAYRMLNLLTPVSYRVRLVDLTVHDTAAEDDPVRGFGFLLEADEAMAARNRAIVSEWEQFLPQGLDAEQAGVVALFQFMIGNTDWSPVEFHNADLIWDERGRYLTVAYDFDFSGIVEAPYASPDPQLPIRSVRDRLYRGFCWEVDHDALNRRFVESRPGLEALWREMELMDEGDRGRGLDYLELFYRVLQSPGEYRRQVVEACRRMPGV